MPESKKPTVLFVDAGPWFGGGQRSLLSLLVAFHESGTIQPLLIAADATRGGLLEQAAALRIPCLRLPARHWRRDLRGIVEFIADRRVIAGILRAALCEYRPDVIHANGIRAAICVLAAGGRRKPPIVLHARDLREPSALSRWAGKRLAAVIAVSEAVARHFRVTARFQGPLHVIPNGFQLDALGSVKPTSAWPWGAEHRTAILVGDLVRWKRHDLFLDATHILRTRVPDFRGVMVGRPVAPDSDRYLEDLRKRAQPADGAELVCFATDVQDALPWISASDVAVSAAPDEPFGRTVVEALALGKPVVAVGGAGPEEILGNSPAGRVCGPSPESIAAGIEHFLCAVDPDTVATAARSRALGFAIEKTTGDITEVYRSLF